MDARPGVVQYRVGGARRSDRGSGTGSGSGGETGADTDGEQGGSGRSDETAAASRLGHGASFRGLSLARRLTTIAPALRETPPTPEAPPTENPPAPTRAAAVRTGDIGRPGPGRVSRRRPGRRLRAGAALLGASLAAAPPAAGQPTVRPAAERPESRIPETGAPGLTRIALYPTPDLAPAGGTALLRWDPGPFGVSVTRDGSQRYRVALEIADLPTPESLGDYRTYVAWATTPVFSPMVRLGAVGNGSFPDLGAVAFDKFVLLVSAEASAAVEERRGRLVLRGASPSTRILPDNHLMVPVSGSGEAGAAPTGHTMSDHAGTDHAARGHGVRGDEAAGAWPHAPMLEETPMIPGLGHLRPAPLPFLPRAGAGETIPEAIPSQVVRLRDGQTLDLVAGRVRRRIHGRDHVMYGFNGEYPGPLMRVDQQATIFVDFENRTRWPTAVHWHGIRLENAFDGVPHLTQDPVPPGGRFRYRIRFPDAGLYWYHPHHREEVQQDLGLYGNLLVEAPPGEWYAAVHREEVLMLDDLLVAEDGGLYPWGEERATHALMGRFGNLLLVNGEPEYRLEVARGETVRFFLTNASNTRTFNLVFGEPGTHRLKVVGSDLSKFEREVWTESVTLAPAERYIVEVQFETPGEHAFENRVRPLEHTFGSYFSRVTRLGTVRVSEREADPSVAPDFGTLRENASVVAEVDRFRERFADPPDYELLLTMEVGGLDPAIMQRMRADRVFFPPVEWAATMPMMNSVSTPDEVRWIVREPATGREDREIAWRFSVGDTARIRIGNDAGALHAMQHPFHIHGQRFLVTARNGVPVENAVFKDTVLIAAGETVDLLLELTNPGKWMAHCHIAEHLEAGMQFVFEVDP